MLPLVIAQAMSSCGAGIFQSDLTYREFLRRMPTKSPAKDGTHQGGTRDSSVEVSLLVILEAFRNFTFKATGPTMRFAVLQFVNLCSCVSCGNYGERAGVS